MYHLPASLPGGVAMVLLSTADPLKQLADLLKSSSFSLGETQVFAFQTSGFLTYPQIEVAFAEHHQLFAAVHSA